MNETNEQNTNDVLAAALEKLKSMSPTELQAFIDGHKSNAPLNEVATDGLKATENVGDIRDYICQVSDITITGSVARYIAGSDYAYRVLMRIQDAAYTFCILRADHTYWRVFDICKWGTGGTPFGSLPAIMCMREDIAFEHAITTMTHRHLLDVQTGRHVPNMPGVLK